MDEEAILDITCDHDSVSFAKWLLTHPNLHDTTNSEVSVLQLDVFRMSSTTVQRSCQNVQLGPSVHNKKSSSGDRGNGHGDIGGGGVVVVAKEVD